MSVDPGPPSCPQSHLLIDAPCRKYLDSSWELIINLGPQLRDTCVRVILYTHCTHPNGGEETEAHLNHFQCTVQWH